MENSAAERAIRPFTTGRKNRVMIDTPNGAEASAVVYSIVETAKANNLNIYKYLAICLLNFKSIYMIWRGRYQRSDSPCLLTSRLS
jgi:hypothetical protein